MKKLLIFGGGVFAKFLKTTIEADGQGPVEAFCVNEAYLAGARAENPGVPVVAFEELDALYGAGNFEILVSVGYHKMNENRAKVFRACDERGYAIASFVHSTATVRCDTVGRGNIIMENCRLHYFTRLGEGNIIIADTALGHETRVGDFCFIAGATTGGLVEIGSYSFIGMKSVVCDHIRLGDHTLLGAGTVASADTKPYTAVMAAKNRIVQAGDAEALGSLLP
ncbi:MAG: hypothetical protein Q4E65_09555 [Clostridia bacterium]|nr:hypothetical protein [Clostridia bacterium]